MTFLPTFGWFLLLLWCLELLFFLFSYRQSRSS